MMKLYKIDVSSAMNFEEEGVTYVIKAKKKPDIKKLAEYLTSVLWTGTVYVDAIEEMDGTEYRLTKTRTFEVDL